VTYYIFSADEGLNNTRQEAVHLDTQQRVVIILEVYAKAWKETLFQINAIMDFQNEY